MEDLGQLQQNTFNFNNIFERAESNFKGKKFILSANHYFSILNKGNSVSTPDKLELIATCFCYNLCFLSAGQLKEKMLNFVLKNENLIISNYLQNLLFNISKRKLIQEEDLKEFGTNCPSIVKSILDASPELVSGSFLEHNLYCLSTVFDSITFDTLNKFLNTTSIENVLFKLIIDGRLRAKIDQESNILFFIKEEILVTDKAIQNFCSRLISINQEYSK